MQDGELGICLNENNGPSMLLNHPEQQPEGFIRIAKCSVSTRRKVSVWSILPKAREDALSLASLAHAGVDAGTYGEERRVIRSLAPQDSALIEGIP